MAPEFVGIEGITDDDRAYRGSRFAEVRDAIFANPYQTVWGRAGEPPLPVYDVTLRRVLRGILPFGRPYLFRKATERAVDSPTDVRWGPDGKGYRRLLHPNGICLTGVWEITEDTPYSGYFRKASRALLIGPTALVQELAPHRKNGVRQCRRLVQRGFRRPLPPSDLASRPKRSRDHRPDAKEALNGQDKPHPGRASTVGCAGGSRGARELAAAVRCGPAGGRVGSCPHTRVAPRRRHRGEVRATVDVFGRGNWRSAAASAAR